MKNADYLRSRLVLSLEIMELVGIILEHLFIKLMRDIRMFLRFLKNQGSGI